MCKRQKLLSMYHLCSQACKWGRGDDTEKEVKPPLTPGFRRIKREIPSQITFYEKINLSSI